MDKKSNKKQHTGGSFYVSDTNVSTVPAAVLKTAGERGKEECSFGSVKYPYKYGSTTRKIDELYDTIPGIIRYLRLLLEHLLFVRRTCVRYHTCTLKAVVRCLPSSWCGQRSTTLLSGLLSLPVLLSV